MTRTECRHCAQPAQLFLCGSCVSELRTMLRGLAHPWLDYLHDAATGQTKLGESGRRSPRYRDRLDGEAELASQIELLPGEQWETVEGPARQGEPWPLKVPVDMDINLARARHERERRALQRALGTAKINLRASEKLTFVHSVLVEWVRDICETRAVQTPVGDSKTLALWMADNVSAIACDEGADVCFREIRQIISDIEWIINRREALGYFGRCPECRADLEAKKGSVHVVCWKCKSVHEVSMLIQRGMESLDESLCSERTVKETFAEIGRPISDRTWRDWRAKDKLIVRGFKDGKPAFWLDDVWDLLAQRPQKDATGSANRCG